MPEYTYKAVNVGGTTWMVKRWTDDPDDYTEAEINVETSDPQVAIDAAVARNSWA